jgi:hypothetical protein
MTLHGQLPFIQFIYMANKCSGWKSLAIFFRITEWNETKMESKSPNWMATSQNFENCAH